MYKLNSNEWQLLRYCTAGILVKHSTIRWGQAVSISLSYIRPEFIGLVPDPFYDSKLVLPLLKAICPDNESVESFVIKPT